MSDDPLRVIECKRAPDAKLVEELEKVLVLAKSGELRTAVLAGVLRDDSVVTLWAGRGRQVTLLGAVRVLEHEIVLSAAGVVCAREEV